MQIDWTLLLLVVIAVIAVIGLILALQTRSGRGRLADAALRLAESLIAYAIRWLERNQGGGAVDVPAAMADNDQRMADARAALMILRQI